MSLRPRCQRDHSGGKDEGPSSPFHANAI